MKIAKYNLIYNDLLNKILSGEFKIGDKFLTEEALKKQYGVSTITVVRVMKELSKDGYIKRVQGHGTFVARITRSKQVTIEQTEHKLDNVIAIRKGSDETILDQLQLRSNDSYYEFILSGEDVYSIRYIPERYLNALSANKNSQEALVEWLEEEFSKQINNQPMEEEVVVKNIHNKEINSITGKLAVQKTKTVYSKDRSQVLEHSKTYIRASKFCLNLYSD